MRREPIPYRTIDWASIARTEHPGETGTSWWRTFELPGVRIRLVEYSPGYLADHWCRKGHVVHCLDGDFVSELASGEESVMHAGMTYVVSDGEIPHRSRTTRGAALLIVDGDFLGTAGS